MGETGRLLSTRLKVHKSSVLNKNMKSALWEPVPKRIGHKFDSDNVNIIDSENNEKMRKIVEVIHIRMVQPGLNRQGGSPVYTQLLQGDEWGNRVKTGQPS